MLTEVELDRHDSFVKRVCAHKATHASTCKNERTRPCAHRHMCTHTYTRASTPTIYTPSIPASAETHVQFSCSVASDSCDPMDCSTQGFPVHHQLSEFTQTRVHRVGDAIQPSHPVVPFSSCLQSFPASGSFQKSQFFESGG